MVIMVIKMLTVGELHLFPDTVRPGCVNGADVPLRRREKQSLYDLCTLSTEHLPARPHPSAALLRAECDLMVVIIPPCAVLVR